MTLPIYNEIRLFSSSKSPTREELSPLSASPSSPLLRSLLLQNGALSHRHVHPSSKVVVVNRNLYRVPISTLFSHYLALESVWDWIEVWDGDWGGWGGNGEMWVGKPIWRMARVRKGIGKMGGCGVGSGDCIPCLWNCCLWFLQI